MDTNNKTPVESIVTATARKRGGKQFTSRMLCRRALPLAMMRNRAFHEPFVPKTQIGCDVFVVRAGICRIPETSLSTNTG
ncbi:MAG: hypothetical protein LBP58_04095 [Azoarcus sp.]|nr:hypothetical protein [Azoarcus sp.]